MSQKSDWELLPEYYDGGNEPVGIWIERNYAFLFFNGQKYQEDKQTVEDAIQDVASKLIEYKKIERPIKFKPKNQNIRGALMMRLSKRMIDLYRSEKRRKELINSLPKEEFQIGFPEDDQDFFEINLEKLENYKSQLSENEQQFLELMLEHGFGKLKPILEKLGLNEKEGRKIRQRIIRKIKRNLLND